MHAAANLVNVSLVAVATILRYFGFPRFQTSVDLPVQFPKNYFLDGLLVTRFSS